MEPAVAARRWRVGGHGRARLSFIAERLAIVSRLKLLFAELLESILILDRLCDHFGWSIIKTGSNRSRRSKRSSRLKIQTGETLKIP
jgi:hypothetical protein